jgi:hypothetical protein
MHFDPYTTPPAIIMTRVAGKALRPSRLTRAMLGGVAEALRALHSVTSDKATGASMPTLIDMAAEQRWFAARITELGEPNAPALAHEARLLGERWLAGHDWPTLLTSARWLSRAGTSTLPIASGMVGASRSWTLNTAVGASLFGIWRI